MFRPKLGDCFEGDQSPGDGSETPIAEYLETIALLHDEVARLEQELQLHCERQRETTSDDAASFRDEVEAANAPENVDGAPEEVERFEAELAGRDETIRLLLDELSRVEEVQAATRSEWEHLAGWVAELEHRVEGQDGDALHQLEDRLATQEQKAEAMRAKSEQDRHAWEAQRRIYQAEIARLQGTLERVATSPEAPGTHDSRVAQGPGPDSNVVEALQAENLRLRAAWQELVERTSGADRSESLDAKLAETLDEQQRLRRQLGQVQDERKRDSLKHEATVAELQARLSQASLTPPQAPPPKNSPEGFGPELEINLRVRALRQHLMEVDHLEKEERRQKNLVSRLSRLWSRTGPR